MVDQCKCLYRDQCMICKSYLIMNLRHESMVDLVALLNELVDENGKILIPGVYDSVKPLTEEERKLYEPIDFSQVKPSTNKVILFINKRLKYTFRTSI